MNSGISVNEPTNFSNVECEGSIFESLLHLALSELSEVTSILGGSTLTDGMGDLSKRFSCFNSAQNLLDTIDGLLLAPGNLLVSQTVHWVSRALVLQKDVGGSDHFWNVEVQKLNVELKGGVLRDYWRVTSSSISVFWRANQGGFLTLRELDDTLVPSSNNLADTYLELEWSSFLYRGIENGSILQSSVVVNSNLSSWWAFWPRSFVMDFDLE